MKVMIIGANGFIGKHLSSYLYQKSSIKLTLFSRKFDPFFNTFTDTKRCRKIKGDYKKTIEIENLLLDQDIVYHLVSISFPASSWKKPLIEVEENLTPSIRLFQSCVDQNVKKVVYISSGGAVYGTQTGYIDETHPTQPFSPYGIVKISIEYFLEYYRKKDGLNYDIYRVSNAYGPYQDKLGFGVINTWLRSIANQEELTIYGDGEISKDYVYIDDIVKMIATTIQSDLSSSDIFNVCSGTSTSLNQIIELLRTICTLDFKLSYREGSESDNKFVSLKNQKIIKRLPPVHRKITSIEEGISKTWNSHYSPFRKN